MIQVLTGIRNTASALDAEHTRLDVIAQNIANSQTTHDVDGKPYQRRVVIFENALNSAMNAGDSGLPTVRVARVERDQAPSTKLYLPENPDADEHGMVAMPNVNIQQEMADMISASRAFEANLRW